MSSIYAYLIFQKVSICTTETLADISGTLLSLIVKLTTAQIECFARVRMRTFLLQKWPSPDKGSVYKILVGKFFSKEKDS